MAWLVVRISDYDDCHQEVRVHMNYENAVKYCEEQNKEYYLNEAKIKVCENCTGNLFATPCENGLIRKDRYGKYCKNSAITCGRSNSSKFYSLIEIEIVE